MMRNIEKSTRFYERTRLELPIAVDYFEDGATRTEIALTNEVAACGIGFVLSYPVEPKRLVKLKLAMPKNLRFFDYGEAFYEVWAIVSSVQFIDTKTPGKFLFRIGTALIGKNPPAGFERDPFTLYDLNPVLPKQGFWHFREIPAKRGRYSRTLEERENYKLNVVIQTLGNDGKIIETLEAKTKDISESGAAVIAKPEFPCPKFVIVASEEGDISLLAVVHHVKPSEESGVLEINLEFISGKWHFL
ncbi:MAG: PilZ domain-containing protein [Pyrinomonadaceae bacterium]|nr:PilZ domain-containing protein [Pyrinomonadaceae bacterium]